MYRLQNFQEHLFWRRHLQKAASVVTKFDGTHFDFNTFWNKFESQIDKSYLPQVQNFLTLKSDSHLPKKIILFAFMKAL